MPWPFGPDEATETADTNESAEKKTLTAWTVSTYYKKSIVEVEHFTKSGKEVIYKTGWRGGSWTVYTNDGMPPEFEFNDAGELDINSCYDNNIEEVDLNETWDGCWDEIEYPDDLDPDERDTIETAAEEDGYRSALEDNDWWSNDTEMWLSGPIIIEGDNGYRRIIVLDDEGNVVDFED